MTVPQSSPTSQSEQEEWRPAPGWEGRYEVSDLGRVRSAQGRYAGHVLSTRPKETGYITVALSRFGKHKPVPVHRLVAGAFIGPCPGGMEVNHKDRNRANPAASNLEYVTHRENLMLSALGPDAVKLTVEKVREILASPLHHDTLQWQYGVSPQHIRAIRSGKYWRDARQAG